MIPRIDVDADIERVAGEQYTAELLGAMQSLRDFAHKALLPPGRIPPQPRGLPPRVIRLALGLYTKAMKQHASVHLLAAHGHSQDAFALSRILFETCLALQAILRRQLRLSRDSSRLVFPGFPLSAERRATMYYAHQLVQEKRLILKSGHPDAEAILRDSDLPAKLDRVRNLLGPWFSLVGARGADWAGVSTQDLARALGMKSFYVSHYREASWSVHPFDVDAYIGFDETGELDFVLKLGPVVRTSWYAMRTANMFLFSCCVAINHRLRLGRESDIQAWSKRLNVLEDRHAALMSR